jgi:hypothetical protein
MTDSGVNWYLMKKIINYEVSPLTMYELSSECFGDPFIIVNHVFWKVAGLFKSLDYDDIPRNENAFAMAYLSKLKLHCSRIVG